MLPPLHNVQVYADTWEFPSVGAALLAFVNWQPEQQREQDGWDRNVATMRYRIGGDATLEYVKCDGGILGVDGQVRYALTVTAGQKFDIVGIIDDNEYLSDPFPDGTRYFEVLTKQKEYHVYTYLDRCVVLTEEEALNVSVGTIIKRLTY